MAFDEAAVDSLIDKIASHANTLGFFEDVITHEPKSAPGPGMYLSIWLTRLRPVQSSGLASVSGLVVLTLRVMCNMLREPQDAIDADVLKATSALLGAYTGDFDLGQSVRAVDLLGMEGVPLDVPTGYITIGSTMYRIAEITLPVIINDMWTEAG
jgi:hypothetical protein